MAKQNEQLKQANAVNRYEVTATDLPLHCPMPGMTLWNSHPRVFLDVEREGHARCPYCSAEFVLKESYRGRITESLMAVSHSGETSGIRF